MNNKLVLALLSTVILTTSCLKDKEYDDSRYGINLDLGEKNVSFTRTPFQNLGAELTTNAVTYKTVIIQSSAVEAPGEDIIVSVAFKQSLLTGTTYTPLPAGALVLPASFKIRKGNLYDTLPLLFPNSSLLDLSKTYGVGLTITSASGGYKLGGNRNDLLLVINLKNQYDGDYSALGYFYHPTAPRTLDADKNLFTTGPNSVQADLGDLGGANFRAIFTVNPADNTVTITPAPGAAGTPYIMYSTSLPTTNPGYTPQWSKSSQCNNTYDPIARVFKVRYGYLGGNGLRVNEEILTRR